MDITTMTPAPLSVAGRGVARSLRYGPMVRRSFRIAFGIAWIVFAIAVVLAWRKVLAVPGGRGDVNGLFVATVCGAAGLLLLTAWLQEQERKR